MHIETILTDLRYALRRLAKAPVFTVTTVLLLALGIGATTSIFTLVYAILFKSLAVAAPNDLYRLGKQAACCNWTGFSQQGGFSMVSYDLYKHLRDHTEGFSELAAFEASESLFGARRAGDVAPSRSVPGEFVSGNYFTMFGVQPAAGRLLTSRDDDPRAAPVVVMSYRLWEQVYHSELSILGNEFYLDGKPFTLIGITPAPFFGDRLRNDPPDFYLPLSSEPTMETNANLNRPDTSWLDVIGRIRPGVRSGAVETRMRIELKQWLRSHWNDMSRDDRSVFPLQTLYLRPGGAGISSMREQYEHWLKILMIAAGFILLVICANIANLMLVRGMEQSSQMSLKMALGAESSRLLREVSIESLLISLTGGAAGLGVALLLTRLILHFAFPAQSSNAGVPIDAVPSAPVLLFTFATASFTAILFSSAFAWMIVRANPVDALRGSTRSGARSDTRSGYSARRILVILQAALSLVLLSVSGLLTAALHRLETQDLGIDEHNRFVIETNPLLAGYRPEQLTPLYSQIQSALTNLSGVSSVGLCSYAPLRTVAFGADVYVYGAPPPNQRDDSFAILNRVTSGYFDAVGTPLLAGRTISFADTANSRHVAVVNEAFARKFFPHENSIGKHFGRWEGGAGQYEVVGVVKDAYYWASDLGARPSPNIFLPEAQHDYKPNAAAEVSPGTHFMNDIVVNIRPGSTPPDNQLRKTLASIDPNLPIISIQSMSERVAAQFVPQRLIARLTSGFGFLSLILAATGLYGTVAYNATSRRGEIGVRIALGATSGSVIRLVMLQGFGLIIVGLTAGFPLTLLAGRFLGSQLYGMNPYNLGVIVTAACALTLSALAASLIPAFRASSISPVDAIRSE